MPPAQVSAGTAAAGRCITAAIAGLGRNDATAIFGLGFSASIRVSPSRIKPRQSSPESGYRAGYDGAKRKRGSKVHMAVDTLGHLLALHVTPANEQDRPRSPS